MLHNATRYSLCTCMVLWCWQFLPHFSACGFLALQISLCLMLEHGGGGGAALLHLLLWFWQPFLKEVQRASLCPASWLEMQPASAS